MNEIHVYTKDLPDSTTSETEIHISSKEDEFVNKIEDNKVTRTEKAGDRKITVISNFWRSYDKISNHQNIKKGIENSEKILKNILMILNE